MLAAENVFISRINAKSKLGSLRHNDNIPASSTYFSAVETLIETCRQGLQTASCTTGYLQVHFTLMLFTQRDQAVKPCALSFKYVKMPLSVIWSRLT
ncbi:hypothetical protein FJD38_02600 [Pseudomonas saxonica]|uniref:Uncharacterized protein n=1 Tax=Pseudomonas saxonica TaxID=2600598 RepID=A0ABY3GLE6_9PSED|nr:hypothetical protein [Pseudomonas saxonica]TWR92530.1 hypothetical protein FJD38_02600 [Pseudomonas saxonica]